MDSTGLEPVTKKLCRELLTWYKQERLVTACIPDFLIWSKAATFYFPSFPKEKQLVCAPHVPQAVHDAAVFYIAMPRDRGPNQHEFLMRQYHQQSN